MIERLQISPQFKDRENYNFMWTMFPNTIAQPPIDTLSTEPDLDYEVTQGSGNYSLLLTLENKESGDRQFFTTTVTVNTEYTVGCYLLKEVDGQTDIDLIKPDWELTENILKRTCTRLEGTPMSFSTCQAINYIDEDGERKEKIKTVWICSDRDVRMLRLDDMSPVHDIHTMFYDAPANEQPQNLVELINRTGMCYFSNSGFYIMPLSVQAAAHRFGLPLRLTNPEAGDREDCSPAKYVLGRSCYYMFYDQLSCRFLLARDGFMYRFQDTDKQGKPAISPNDMNSDLIYMGSTVMNGYALMSDKKDQSKCIYTLEKAEYEKSPFKLFSPLVSRTDLASSSKIANAKVFGHNENYAYFYCAIENQLHLFDIGQNKETENILPGLDGKITLIQHLRTKLPGSDAKEYLVVATEKGGRYKIGFYEMLAGKPDLTKTPKTLEGEGRVSAIYQIK